MTKTKKNASRLTAFCWQSGLLEIGLRCPRGAIRLFRGPAKAVQDTVVATSRLAYDNKTSLVPGVPEADDVNQKLDAVIKYRRWVLGRRKEVR